METVQNLTYTPLSRPLYLYVKAGRALARPEVQEFLRFSVADANVYTEEVGYVDSPLKVYTDDQAKLEAAIAGSAQPDGPAAAGDSDQLAQPSKSSVNKTPRPRNKTRPGLGGPSGRVIGPPPARRERQEAEIEHVEIVESILAGDLEKSRGEETVMSPRL